MPGAPQISEGRILLTGAVIILPVCALVVPVIQNAFRPTLNTMVAEGPTVQVRSRGRDSSDSAADTRTSPGSSPSASSQSLLDDANLRLQGKDYAGAIPLYEQFLADHEDAQVMTSLAICLRQTGQLDRALERLRQSLALDPNAPDTLYYHGLLHQYDLGDFATALQSYRRVIELGYAQQFPDISERIEYIERVRASLLAPSSPAATPATVP